MTRMMQVLIMTRRALMISIGLATLAVPAYADALGDILEQKKIVVGAVNDFPPFGFLDAEQVPQGYDIDVAKAIAEKLGVDLELVAVSAANRIPYLTSKRVDVLVASLGITPERAEQVLFTNPYAATQSTVLAPEGTEIRTIEDLVGKRVSVARGSSNDIFFSSVAPEGVNVMRFDGEGAASQAMLADQVDALVITNTMVSPVAQSRPELKLTTKLLLRQQENAIAVRRGETALAERINAILEEMKRDGSLAELYRRWTSADLPELKARTVQ